MNDQVNREFAKAVIKRVSPRELPLFDDIWADLKQDDSLPIDRADSSEREIGFGGLDVAPDLLSTLLVPILSSVTAKKAVSTPSRTAEAVVVKLRERAVQRRTSLEPGLESLVERAVSEALEELKIRIG